MARRKPFSGLTACQTSFSLRSAAAAAKEMTDFKALVLSFLVLVSAVKCENQGLDYRIVNYEDLLPGLQQFFDDGVVHFDQLLFDAPHHQLIVGKKLEFVTLTP